MVTRGKLLRMIDEARVKEAIRKAERKSSGEIRVSVAPLFWGDVQKAAQKAFERMDMAATKDRNGVLFFIVPARRKLVVLGDTGIHERVGQEFWHRIAQVVTEKFRERDFTEGLLEGIALIGEQLAAHFPPKAGRNPNELPDDLDFGAKS